MSVRRRVWPVRMRLQPVDRSRTAAAVGRQGGASIEEPLGIVQTDEPEGLRLIGEFDMSNADELGRALTQASSSRGPVTLDMSDLTFIDGSGIRAIVRYALSMNGQPPVVLHRPSGTVMRILEIFGADQMLQLQVTRDDGADRRAPGPSVAAQGLAG